MTFKDIDFFFNEKSNLEIIIHEKKYQHNKKVWSKIQHPIYLSDILCHGPWLWVHAPVHCPHSQINGMVPNHPDLLPDHNKTGTVNVEHVLWEK